MLLIQGDRTKGNIKQTPTHAHSHIIKSPLMNILCTATCFNPSGRITETLQQHGWTKWVTSCTIQVSVYHV